MYNESIHVLVMSIAPPLYIQTILALVSLCFTLRFKVRYILTTVWAMRKVEVVTVVEGAL